MNYAKIDRCEYVNGNGIGVSLYVSGCHFHCPGCFNQDAWDFNYGKTWNDEAMNELLNYADKPYIHRITILGGEPLARENAPEVVNIVKKIKKELPDKELWLYTGMVYEELYSYGIARILLYIDVLVDGKFDITKKDTTLKFVGSLNQRLIDVQKTLAKGKIVLYNN